MSYIALARKWRPKLFGQLIGQEHITKALVNSLNQSRMHHAYLFSGTHGVGKTSLARLVAKALNCEQGVTSTPCLQCEICHAVEQGRFIDLIEIDAASKTRVEDTRELLENVPYTPAHGRFKIYLIDEVHMLSLHSFNALLKTLEDPPQHVKFLLATTDPQKLPVTVLSRCLQFHLKPIPTHLIKQQMTHILKEEGVSFEEEALGLLAHAAKGSMRDALSMLDQALACNEQYVESDAVKNLLGYTQKDYAIDLLHALVNASPDTMMQISQTIACEGGNYHYVLEELLHHLHQISITQILPDDSPFIKSSAAIQELSSKISPEDSQLFYQIALKGQEELHLAPSPGIGFEMTLLRMHTFKPLPSPPYPSLAHNSNQASSSIKPDELLPIQKTSYPSKTIENTHEKPIQDKASQPADDEEKEVEWQNLLPKLNLKGLSLSAAEHAELLAITNNSVTLQVTSRHLSLFTETVSSRIEQALSNYYHKNIKLSIDIVEKTQASPAQKKEVAEKEQQQNGMTALMNDPVFQKIKTTFSAELVKNSIVVRQDGL